MEELIQKSDKKISSVSLEIQRYLLPEIDSQNRMTIIKGARGVGKTTMLLQYARIIRETSDSEVLYVALDDLFFQGTSLYQLAEEFSKKYNGHLLLLDEVHKYPGWSRELKLIYDDIPELRLVVTSSSLLDIYQSEADLSRRAVPLLLKELSFREFLIFEKGPSFEAITLPELLEHHRTLSHRILSEIKPLFEFYKYQQYGMYPYFLEGVTSFEDKLLRTVNLILEVDLPSVEALDYQYIVKLKKLLFAISTSAPFTPNVSKLSERIGISRPGLIKALHYLERARLIISINKHNKGISILSKPDKLFVNNPNIQLALAGKHVNQGALRESFFINQIEGLYSAVLPPKGDFLIDNQYTFEIGGRGKSSRQVHGIPDSFVVKDDIENGMGNTIPLWLFGFLY